MRDRHRKTFTRFLHDAPFEPVRAAFRMGRDDDLVCAEGTQRVLYRLEGVAVADFASRFDAGFRKLGEALVEPLRSRGSGAVVVRDPVP
jgi:hypothetical protein